MWAEVSNPEWLRNRLTHFALRASQRLAAHAASAACPLCPSAASTATTKLSKIDCRATAASSEFGPVAEAPELVLGKAGQ